MPRTCFVTLMLATALLGLAPASPAAEPTAPAAGQPKLQTAVFEVANNDRPIPQSSPPSSSRAGTEMSEMLCNQALCERAAAEARKKLNLGENEGEFVLGGIARAVSGRPFRIEVSFRVSEHTPSAVGPFLDAVAQQWQEAYRELEQGQVDKLRREVKVAEGELELARAELARWRHQQQKLCEDAGRSDLSREGILAAVKALEEEKRKLQMDQVGFAARQQALERSIAEIAHRAEAKAAEDPVADELKRIVELREKELAMAQALFKVGKMPASEVGDVEIKMAEARAEWLKRREAVGALAGRDVLAKLNQEFSTIVIDNAETKARLEHIERQLAADRRVLPLADKYQDSVAFPLKLADREVQSALQRCLGPQRELRAFAPATVVVVSPK
ncbi:MAG: hypothetical protein IMZ44_02310 [Planctomycetes bacterium]|nr:hypothetical protein [Planctomycetota bacterium]